MKTIIPTLIAAAGILFYGSGSYAQVSINSSGTPPDASSMLDVNSTNKGLLIPRMDVFTRNAITLPATGLMIYQTSPVPGININTGTPGSPDWLKLVDPYDLLWTRNGGLGYSYLSNRTDSVGIGTVSTPTAKLQVRGLHTATAGTNGIFVDIKNTSTTTNTLSGLRFSGGSYYKAAVYFQKQTGEKGRLIFANDISGDADAVNAVDGKMMINENGRLLVNSTTDNGNQLYLSGEAYKTSGTGSWLIPSDARLKDLKGSFDRGINEIMQLQPIYFQYKKDNDLGLMSGKEYVGMLAQKVELIIPEAVGYDDNGYLTFSTDPVIYTMLNAIKEQQVMIQELKFENQELIKRLQLLENSLNTQVK